MKSVGIVGLPGAGTSTIFTALTAVEGSASSRTHQAAVPVPDDRVAVLARLQSSEKITQATLRFVEVSGLVRRGARGAGSLSDELIGNLRECDALLLVVRAFALGGPPDPAGDLADLSLELVFADLCSIEAGLERAVKAAKAADPQAKRELSVLERARELLQAGAALSTEAWDDEARRVLNAMSPLTLKPAVALASIGEEGPGGELPEGSIGVAGRLEAEVAGLSPEEAVELLASYGQVGRGIDRVIRAIYERLDLITFLTANSREARAWQVRRGATAPEAAGAIHTDFERGFIKAETVAYDDLVAAGGWQQAKAKGLVRQEGKTYVVREGDVIEFRFGTTAPSPRSKP